MAPTFRIKFTETNSGSSTAAPVLTVPAGTISSDVVVFAVCFITASTLTATATHTGSGTVTEISPAGMLLGTSAQGFVYRGTGFVAGDTITITPSTLNRSVGAGVVYSSAAYEKVGTAGATSTTVANAPSVATNTNNDIAVSFSFGIASSTGRTFSSYTASWNSRSFIQGGSTTRFPMIDIHDLTVATAGASGATVATASGTLLSSTGIQVVVTTPAAGGSTVRKVDVAGTPTTLTARRANVAGVSTAASRKVNVGGVAT